MRSGNLPIAHVQPLTSKQYENWDFSSRSFGETHVRDFAIHHDSIQSGWRGNARISDQITKDRTSTNRIWIDNFARRFPHQPLQFNLTSLSVTIRSCLFFVSAHTNVCICINLCIHYLYQAAAGSEDPWLDGRMSAPSKQTAAISALQNRISSPPIE